MYFGWYATSLDELYDTNTTDDRMKQSVAFKQFPLDRPFKRYIKVGKYYSKRGGFWIPTG